MSFKYLLFFFMLSVSGLAGESDQYYNDLFEEANLAYKEGAYDSAKSIYGEIAQNGIISSELFYNIGNCNYKIGAIASAILNYERALRLAPDNEDIRYNLEIANNRITDKIEPIDTFFLTSWWQNLALTFHPDIWGWVSLGLFAFMIVAFSLFIIGKESEFRKLGFISSVICLFLFAVAFGLANSALHWKNKTEAIVFAPTINVKSEPSLNGTDQFVLHEGVKVSVIDEDNDWVRIKLGDGNSGWVSRQSIESI
jgi:tetratricopeptide (TPR) repeat protein